MMRHIVSEPAGHNRNPLPRIRKQFDRLDTDGFTDQGKPMQAIVAPRIIRAWQSDVHNCVYVQIGNGGNVSPARYWIEKPTRCQKSCRERIDSLL